MTRQSAKNRNLLTAIAEENALLREEVKVARRASDITARLVVEQFVKIEAMIQKLVESQTSYRELYHQSSQREQLYESLLNSTPDAVAICNLKCQITYINPAFSKVFGFFRDDVLEKDAHFFVPASERAKCDAVIEQVLAGQPVSHLETKRINKQGRELDVTLSASCYADHLGKPAGVMMILQDITRSKKAERLLQKERETFLTILQEAPYGVGMLDKDANMVYVNPQFTEIIGYSLDEIPTLSAWLEKAYPSAEQRQNVIANWNLQTPREKREKVFSVACKSGTIKDVEFRRAVLDDGKVIVTLSDVTERQRTEEQIRRAKEQWEKTFDSLDDAITIQDLDMRMLRVNRAAARMLSLEPQELIGRLCFEVFANSEQPCRDCPQRLTSKDSSPHSCEIEHYSLGKTFLVTTSPIFNENGELSGIVHYAKDITENRKIEEELTKAQKLESVGLLAGGIAHDFNNILTAILGNVNLAKMYAGSGDKASSRLEEAEKACLRAKDLTHQLLTFSKGGAPIKKTASIADLVKESSSFALMGSNVRCKYEICQNPWPVEIDEGQMSQVINNLIINACQAMPNGGDIEIGLENAEHVKDNKTDDGRSDHGQYVRISIRDEGIGIPKENLAKIFDPYFTTKPGGSGLGLSMAYSIIKRHDGRMRVDSKPGVGTTFYIDLPASNRSPFKATEKGESYALGAGKGKVLLMDDEESIRDLVGQMLDLLGYEVSFARDGSEAIEIYTQANQSGEPFDAIIMDLTVPGGMGGKDALEKLRQANPEIVAIVSSGYHTDPIMSNFKQYGFSGVIAKPYSMNDLGETLRIVLESRHDPPISTKKAMQLPLSAPAPNPGKTTGNVQPAGNLSPNGDPNERIVS